jgi:hypothetical protein
MRHLMEEAIKPLLGFLARVEFDVRHRPVPAKADCLFLA